MFHSECCTHIKHNQFGNVQVRVGADVGAEETILIIVMYGIPENKT